MKVRIVEIHSGKEYTDKQRRVTLKFEDGSSCFDRVTLPENALGWAAGAVQLDDEIEVTLTKVVMPRVGLSLEPLPTERDKVVAGTGWAPTSIRIREAEPSTADLDAEVPRG